MIWAILALIGVPLWLCAIAIAVLVFQEQNAAEAARGRPCPPTAGRQEAVDSWSCDLGFRRVRVAGRSASWNEGLVQVTDASVHEDVDPRTAKKLRGLGDSPVIASLALVGGTIIDVAARPEQRSALTGPFAKQPRVLPRR